jgi:hypothetical protein
VAGFISESWPGSNRNGGRHQIGIPGRIASEFAGKRAAGKGTDRAKRIGTGQSGAGCKQPRATGNGPSGDGDCIR